MANRYDEDRRNYGRRSGAGYGSRSFRRGDGGFEGDYESNERYFGGGRTYGEGYDDYEEPSRQSFGGYGGSGSTGYGRGGGWSGGSRGSRDYDQRSSYYGSPDRDYNENLTGRYGGQISYGRNRWTDSGYGRGVYGGSYPESERGYMTGPERNRVDDRGWWDRTADEVASWFGDEEAARRRQMDEQQNYRGRGPRGYTRSDERIKEDINDELTDSYQLDAWDIDVEVNDGNVVLSGAVNSRYEKRLAEDLAEDVSGVKNVENRLRVNQSFTQTSTEDTGTSTTSRRSASA